MRAWLLPEYIEDILPAEARRIERLRRLILDDFAVHGYELVMPPLLEYVDSLLTGTGHDLDLQTFKLVDQLTGRMLGVRADITPQVARIDAHLLNRGGITRLCYTGSVLRTLPGMNRTREPLQIGAEIYGHAGIESDVEVQRLLLRALRLAGVRDVSLDIGHVAVFRALLRRVRVSRELEAELFQAMQSKDVTSIIALTKGLDRVTRAALAELPGLYGGTEVLARAKRVLPALPEIRAALRDLAALSQRLADLAKIRSFDLGELRGYHYHSGVVFAAYRIRAPMRWRWAAVTTRSAKPSAVRDRQPVSAWTCANWRRPVLKCSSRRVFWRRSGRMIASWHSALRLCVVGVLSSLRICRGMPVSVQNSLATASWLSVLAAGSCKSANNSASNCF